MELEEKVIFFPSTIFSTHLSLLTYIMDLDAGTEP